MVVAQPETFHLLNTGSQPTNTTKEPAMEERSIPEMRRRGDRPLPKEELEEQKGVLPEVHVGRRLQLSYF